MSVSSLARCIFLSLNLIFTFGVAEFVELLDDLDRRLGLTSPRVISNSLLVMRTVVGSCFLDCLRKLYIHIFVVLEQHIQQSEHVRNGEVTHFLRPDLSVVLVEIHGLFTHQKSVSCGLKHHVKVPHLLTYVPCMNRVNDPPMDVNKMHA